MSKINYLISQCDTSLV